MNLPENATPLNAIPFDDNAPSVTPPSPARCAPGEGLRTVEQPFAIGTGDGGLGV
jgi:hypothetical protein